MFKIPHPPSTKEKAHAIADFAELIAWDKGFTSLREIAASLGRTDDNDSNIGIIDNDVKTAEFLEEVMREIDSRAQACGDGYPFELKPKGNVLRYLPKIKGHRSDLYRYLLLSTRLDMKTSRFSLEIDGTLLLEEISAEVLRHYLGQKRARSVVFGTATAGKFEDKITQLCQELGEGTAFVNRDSAPVTENDDCLDVVAWIPFSDKRGSQMIVFSQCKTGTSWRDDVSKLQPSAFIDCWMQDSFLVNPIRAFCVAEAVDRSRWKKTCIKAGILFDRCRLVDFCDDLEPGLLKRVKLWTAAAKKTFSYKV
jgi:hypothetical protein